MWTTKDNCEGQYGEMGPCSPLFHMFNNGCQRLALRGVCVCLYMSVCVCLMEVDCDWLG